MGVGLMIPCVAVRELRELKKALVENEVISGSRGVVIALEMAIASLEREDQGDGWIPTYKQGTEDAWEFARHLNALSHDITDIIYLSMNGGKGLDVALEMTYEEAKKEYDEYYQKKREKAFCVGAEVKNNDGEIAYVLNPDYDGCLVLSMQEYVCPQIQRKEDWKCTGAINDQIEHMLMR